MQLPIRMYIRVPPFAGGPIVYIYTLASAHGPWYRQVVARDAILIMRIEREVKTQFVAAAQRDGVSLSEWLRTAGLLTLAAARVGASPPSPAAPLPAFTPVEPATTSRYFAALCDRCATIHDSHAACVGSAA